jgi:hypothetical protein
MVTDFFEEILKDNAGISQLQTDHDNRLKLRCAKLKPDGGLVRIHQPNIQ